MNKEIIRRQMTLRRIIFFTAIFLGVLTSCSHEPENTTGKKKVAHKVDKNPSLIKFNGKMFSVPSPFQIAFLVKETAIPFNGDLVNSLENRTKYLNEFQKSMNLGVYGSNLGYLTINDQLPLASKYFANVKKLTQDLHMESVIDPDMMSRVEKNMDNKDSLLNLVALSFRNADSYLMENQRTEVAVMILTGAWVETIYLLTQLAPSSNEHKIIDRIGEQKYSLDNILELLRPYYGSKSKEFDTITERLVDLATVFDGVTIDYIYHEPVTDLRNKTTIVTSVTKTNISDYQLKTITDMVSEIRSMIVD